MAANLRVRQKEHTRRAILEHALNLFQEHGYVATTIDDIATSVGTTRVTFYAHFANKTELMRALFEELNRNLERQDDGLEHRSTARPLVEATRLGTFAAIRGWIGAQSTRWPAIRPYIIVVAEASAVDPEIRELNEAWFGEVIDDITEGLAQAGRFDPDTRRFRGYLAMELLNSANLRWIRHPWPLETGTELDILAGAWTHLLGE
ncbi:TetR/AcrR family transcriptional regulator [Microbacterium protaetiae]|uniref:TetR/AcrR family transcriptional regulator n=1 Tax=Microbacterium protaetiae TaxID=2509458 RepID=A0A4P6EC34_9MICO|nr:TetR/AcrR family transcriptional regulator [Microbacterium protaetiae]QAY59775.1 TetR/AcrR family transcriptional regulator [Microbacterium protaetiae]